MLLVLGASEVRRRGIQRVNLKRRRDAEDLLFFLGFFGLRQCLAQVRDFLDKALTSRIAKLDL